MRSFLATSNSTITGASSSQLGNVFESSSEDKSHSNLDNATTNPSTDSSASSVSPSSSSSVGDQNSPLISSDHTVRSRVPPNTPKKASSEASVETKSSRADKESNENADSVSTRQRRLSKLSDELHAVLGPHQPSPTHSRRAPNAYYYVHNDNDYHMHYHQSSQRKQPPNPAGSTSQPMQHNLCPAEYDAIDSWRIIASTLHPLSPSEPPTPPDTGARTPDWMRTKSEAVSPILLLQRLRALSNDLEKPRGTGGRGRGRGRGHEHVQGREPPRSRMSMEDNGGYQCRKKISGSPSPAPTPARSPARMQPNGSGKKKRGGGVKGSPRHHVEKSGWVAMDGEMMVCPEMAVGSMSEVECTWTAPKPKFLTKLFK